MHEKRQHVEWFGVDMTRVEKIESLLPVGFEVIEMEEDDFTCSWVRIRKVGGEHQGCIGDEIPDKFLPEEINTIVEALGKYE